MSTIKPWTSPIDSKQIDKDLLKFYFDQSEKYLKTSIELADRITTRCYNLLTIVIPILSVVLVTLAKHMFSQDKLPTMAIVLLFALLIPLLTCLYLLIWAAFPKLYTRLGSEPKNKVHPRFFDNPEFTGEQSYKLVMTFELEEYQGRMEYVDQQNNKRIKNIQYVFYIMAALLQLMAVALFFAFVI